MFMPPVFPAHWHVSQPVLIADTFSSLVWKVSLPDGTPAIVKGLKPIKDIVLTPKSWTVKHEAYRSDSDIQLESDLLISG